LGSSYLYASPEGGKGGKKKKKRKTKKSSRGDRSREEYDALVGELHAKGKKGGGKEPGLSEPLNEWVDVTFF